MGFSSALPASRTHRVVVIGAGVGGLVAALDLAAAGIEVMVVDPAAAPGGKLREVQVAGRPIDAGPTVFTMRPVFEAIFARAGTSLAAELQLTSLEVLARHAWGPGDPFDLFADLERSVDSIGALAGAGEAARYRSFCKRAERIYRTLERPFMRAAAPSLAGLARSVGIGPDLWSIAPFTTLWGALGEYFHDPRLHQLFGRYATYCGSSPFRSPATLMLVAHVEREGVWIIGGGMHRLAAVLARLATEKGARFRFGVAARKIHVEGGRAAMVELETGERLAADAVVCNADVAALASGLLGEDVRGAVPIQKPAGRSLSAVTFAIAAETRGFPLHRHNVFFSNAYAAEFDDIFGRQRLPRAPSVYVCAQDRGDSGALPSGGNERLFCIVNAPATAETHAFDRAEIEQCQDRTFSLLKRCGLTVEHRPEAVRMTTPNDFARLFPGTGGAIYGAASHGSMASFRRPAARSRLPGLYLCGGSVHPGPGLPMAALSGQMAASCLLSDLASTRRWRPVVMPGGMSTA